MWWWSCLDESGCRKTRFKTESKSLWLSEYLVRKNLMGFESYSPKELVILKTVFLWLEWYEKLRFQKLSLMLKFSVIIRTLLILTSVSFIYFFLFFFVFEINNLLYGAQWQSISTRDYLWYINPDLTYAVFQYKRLLRNWTHNLK